MNRKKFNIKSTLLSVLLLLTLLCSSLTGCSGNKPNDTQSSISTESESELDSGSEIGSEIESETETSSETESESEPESETEKLPDNSGTNNNAGNNSTGDTNTGNTNTGNGNTGNTNTDNGNTGNSNTGNSNSGSTTDFKTPGISLSQIPAYSGKEYYELNNNTPHFSTINLSTTAFEYYSELDSLGRCGVAYACLGPELLPTEERGDIDSVTPSGWVSSDSGNSLYNRSHLIAHSLAGENANNKNLITGTSYMNQHTMQIFENQVLDYIKETGNHVMYRVTPFFDGNNLVAAGVQMEAWSVEDKGISICFNVFCYNIQEGISIDYATGNYSIVETNYKYIVNGKNGKIHTYECGINSNMSKPIYCETLEEAKEESAKILGTATGAGCCKPLP